MLIIYEGMDKVGKTTLIKEYDRFDHFNHYNMDRGPAGYILYDSFFGRTTAERKAENLQAIQELNGMDYIVVYLTAETESIQSRLDFFHEILPDGMEINSFRDAYEKVVFDSYPKDRILRLNTTNLSLEECCLKIDKFIKDRKSIPGFDNLNLDHKYATDEHYTEYLPSQNVFTKENLETLPDFEKEVDPTFYTMMEANLDQIVHMYEVGILNHRQMVFTSNECISFVQILIEREEVIFYVVQRSFNIEKHKLNDLMFFYDYWKNRKEKFGANRGIKVYYNVVVPHFIER